VTRQLPLQMVTRVRYAPENFLIHSGMVGVVEGCRSLFARDAFSLAFISGSPRAGKTHLSIFLIDALEKLARFPRLLEGGELGRFLTTSEGESFTSEDVFVVDDAHAYLSSLRPGDSGPFVSFVERLRVARAGLVLLSAEPLDRFSFDEHVRSRLVPGSGLIVEAPAESDMPALIDMMARQRGIKLKERKIGFIVRRLGRDIGALERYFDRVQHLADVLGQSVRFPVLGDAL